jgi:D-alanyl-D-alanine carboxypeptidase (penicillin-binding protein 5/6)
MRAIKLLVVVLCCGLLAATLSPTESLASPAGLTSGPPAVHQIAEIGATAAIAVDLTNGLQLYASNADTPVPPASTMKLATVIVARSILSPGELVEITDADLYLGEDYSQMGLMAGDVVSVEALFYGATMASGADAALALARVAGNRLEPGTGDPVGRFVAEMNTWAARHQMYNSHFTNPVGFDDDGHVVTARDLVRLVREILKDPLLARVFTTPEVIVHVDGPNAREMYLVTTNQLMLTGDAIGGKTGTEDLAGECLVNIVRRGEHLLVTVVMGSQDRYGDTWEILNDLEQRISFVDFGSTGWFPGLQEDLASRGLFMPVGTTRMMTREQAENLSYRLELANEPSPAGRAGVVVFLIGQRELLRLPVHRQG